MSWIETSRLCAHRISRSLKTVCAYAADLFASGESQFFFYSMNLSLDRREELCGYIDEPLDIVLKTDHPRCVFTLRDIV